MDGWERRGAGQIMRTIYVPHRSVARVPQIHRLRTKLRRIGSFFIDFSCFISPPSSFWSSNLRVQSLLQYLFSFHFDFLPVSTMGLLKHVLLPTFAAFHALVAKICLVDEGLIANSAKPLGRDLKTEPAGIFEQHLARCVGATAAWFL